MIDLARVYSERFPKNEITWAELGPSLLTAIVQAYPKHGFNIYSPEFANHINYFDCPNMFISEDTDFIFSDDIYFLHMYNEMWRTAGVDKNFSFQKNCLYEKLALINDNG